MRFRVEVAESDGSIFGRFVGKGGVRCPRSLRFSRGWMIGRDRLKRRARHTPYASRSIDRDEGGGLLGFVGDFGERAGFSGVRGFQFGCDFGQCFEKSGDEGGFEGVVDVLHQGRIRSKL